MTGKGTVRNDVGARRLSHRRAGLPLLGSASGRWGIRHARGRRYVVYLIGRARLTEFDSLRSARRFCEAIDGLTHWSRPDAKLRTDREFGLAVHRAALRVTRGRPDLRIVAETARNGILP
jgi:hypothetical protein